jgi:hypothetical protein
MIIFIKIMFHTTIAHFPVVLKHDFPNEEENYIDEKIDEGQYKKRYRYDRDLRVSFIY